MIWLLALAWYNKIPLEIIQVLAALHWTPATTMFRPPPSQSFQIDRGYGMDERALKSELDSAAIDCTPESSLPPHKGESNAAFTSRIRLLREANKEKALQHFIAGLRTQWPARCPSTPNDKDSPKFRD
jgi:hypothetical protein